MRRLTLAPMNYEPPNILDVMAITLRYIKILLSMSVAAWGIIAGAMNLIYYNHRGVSLVMSMQGEDSVRAISTPTLFAIGYAFIY